MSSRPADNPIDKECLERFLRRVPALSDVVENHSQLVGHFGYYLTEELGEIDVTSRRLRACYDAASIPTPANIADTMRKSHAFVDTGTGTKLHRDVRNRIQKSLERPQNVERGEVVLRREEASPEKGRNVVVVHGKDSGIRDSMFGFLRSVGLAPMEWSEAVRRTGRGAPYNGEVVDALFREAQAVVVILSPDEHVELREDLQAGDSSDNKGWQPRPNVFIEAGMALARDEAHTVLVEVGTVRLASDLMGRNSIRFDGSSTHRHDLLERLRTAGCAVSTSGSDWLRVGDFGLPSRSFGERGRRTR